MQITKRHGNATVFEGSQKLHDSGDTDFAGFEVKIRDAHYWKAMALWLMVFSMILGGALIGALLRLV